jgi:hypothetical protein
MQAWNQGDENMIDKTVPDAETVTQGIRDGSTILF